MGSGTFASRYRPLLGYAALILLSALFFCHFSFAADEDVPRDLAQTFSKAISFDAHYLAAQANAQARQEDAAIAFSSLLPHLKATGKKSSGTLKTGGAAESHYLDEGYTISLTQTLFNTVDRETLNEAELSILLSSVQLAQARQTLVADVLIGYLEVLMERRKLDSLSAKEEALRERVMADEDAWRRGTLTIVEVKDSQARLDQLKADMFEASRRIEIGTGKLQRMTGDSALNLKPLEDNSIPDISSIYQASEWIQLAERNNLEVMRFELEASLAQVRVNKIKGEYFPTIQLVASHSHGTASYLESEAGVNTANRVGQGNAIGVQVTIPIFDGLNTTSRQRKAIAEKQGADADQIDAVRKAHEQAQQALLEFRIDLERSAALESALKAAQELFNATKKSVQRGIRINLDVLDAAARVESIRGDIDHYRLKALIDDIRVRRVANILDDSDIERVNRLLYSSEVQRYD